MDNSATRFWQQTATIYTSCLDLSSVSWLVEPCLESFCSNYSYFVSFLVQPKITYLNNQTASEFEEQVTLTCEASGDPTPTISWSFENRVFSEGEQVLVYFLFTVQQKWTILLSNSHSCSDAQRVFIIRLNHHVLAHHATKSLNQPWHC